MCVPVQRLCIWRVCFGFEDVFTRCNIINTLFPTRKQSTARERGSEQARMTWRTSAMHILHEISIDQFQWAKRDSGHATNERHGDANHNNKWIEMVSRICLTAVEENIYFACASGRQRQSFDAQALASPSCHAMPSRHVLDDEHWMQRAAQFVIVSTLSSIDLVPIPEINGRSQSLRRDRQQNTKIISY